MCVMMMMMMTSRVGTQGPAENRQFLSGLLIGAELAGAGVKAATTPTVWLVSCVVQHPAHTHKPYVVRVRSVSAETHVCDDVAWVLKVGSSALCAKYEAALAVLGVAAKNDTAANTTTAGILAASRAASILPEVATEHAAADARPTSPVAYAPTPIEPRPATAKPDWWG